MKKIISAPYIDQTEQWVYGCESVSTVMLLQYLEINIDPDIFIDNYLPIAKSYEKNGVMFAENPSFYYINNPRDLSGWGCYAPCIVNAIEAVLENEGLNDEYCVIDETGKTAKELCEEYIENDMPVVFWATLNFEDITGESTWVLPNGEVFTWVSGEHCLLLVGYDDENYWFNDPWQNHGCVPCPKEVVERRHREQGMYAVAVKPNSALDGRF